MHNNKEIWKDVVGYEGLYQVSNLGRVRSMSFNCNNKKKRILKNIKTTNGYYQVHLVKDGIYKCKLIHRIVAEAFISNTNNYRVINHIDKNPKNNKVSNLEWCTLKHNVRHSISKPCVCIKENKIIKKYRCLIDVKEDGFIPSCVSNCCKGKSKSHHGYQWKYR